MDSLGHLLKDGIKKVSEAAMDAVVTSIIANQEQHLNNLQDMQKWAIVKIIQRFTSYKYLHQQPCVVNTADMSLFDLFNDSSDTDVSEPSSGNVLHKKLTAPPIGELKIVIDEARLLLLGNSITFNDSAAKLLEWKIIITCDNQLSETTSAMLTRDIQQVHQNCTWLHQTGQRSASYSPLHAIHWGELLTLCNIKDIWADVCIDIVWRKIPKKENNQKTHPISLLKRSTLQDTLKGSIDPSKLSDIPLDYSTVDNDDDDDDIKLTKLLEDVKYPLRSDTVKSGGEPSGTGMVQTADTLTGHTTIRTDINPARRKIPTTSEWQIYGRAIIPLSTFLTSYGSTSLITIPEEKKTKNHLFHFPCNDTVYGIPNYPIHDDLHHTSSFWLHLFPHEGNEKKYYRPIAGYPGFGMSNPQTTLGFLKIKIVFQYNVPPLLGPILSMLHSPATRWVNSFHFEPQYLETYGLRARFILTTYPRWIHKFFHLSNIQDIIQQNTFDFICVILFWMCLMTALIFSHPMFIPFWISMTILSVSLSYRFGAHYIPPTHFSIRYPHTKGHYHRSLSKQSCLKTHQELFHLDNNHKAQSPLDFNSFNYERRRHSFLRDTYCQQHKHSINPDLPYVLNESASMSQLTHKTHVLQRHHSNSPTRHHKRSLSESDHHILSNSTQHMSQLKEHVVEDTDKSSCQSDQEMIYDDIGHHHGLSSKCPNSLDYDVLDSSMYRTGTCRVDELVASSSSSSPPGISVDPNVDKSKLIDTTHYSTTHKIISESHNKLSMAERFVQLSPTKMGLHMGQQEKQIITGPPSTILQLSNPSDIPTPQSSSSNSRTPLDKDANLSKICSVVDSPFGELALSIRDPTSYCPNFPVFAEDAGDQDLQFLIEHGIELLDALQRMTGLFSSMIEKLKFSLNWEDPFITINSYIIIAVICIHMTFLLYLCSILPGWITRFPLLFPIFAFIVLTDPWIQTYVWLQIFNINIPLLYYALLSRVTLQRQRLNVSDTLSDEATSPNKKQETKIYTESSSLPLSNRLFSPNGLTTHINRATYPHMLNPSIINSSLMLNKTTHDDTALGSPKIMKIQSPRSSLEPVLISQNPHSLKHTHRSYMYNKDVPSTERYSINEQLIQKPQGWNQFKKSVYQLFIGSTPQYSPIEIDKDTISLHSSEVKTNVLDDPNQTVIYTETDKSSLRQRHPKELSQSTLHPIQSGPFAIFNITGRLSVSGTTTSDSNRPFYCVSIYHTFYWMCYYMIYYMLYLIRKLFCISHYCIIHPLQFLLSSICLYIIQWIDLCFRFFLHWWMRLPDRREIEHRQIAAVQFVESLNQLLPWSIRNTIRKNDSTNREFSEGSDFFSENKNFPFYDEEDTYQLNVYLDSKFRKSYLQRNPITGLINMRFIGSDTPPVDEHVKKTANDTLTESHTHTSVLGTTQQRKQHTNKLSYTSNGLDTSTAIMDIEQDLQINPLDITNKNSIKSYADIKSTQLSNDNSVSKNNDCYPMVIHNDHITHTLTTSHSNDEIFSEHMIDTHQNHLFTALRTLLKGSIEKTHKKMEGVAEKDSSLIPRFPSLKTTWPFFENLSTPKNSLLNVESAIPTLDNEESHVPIMMNNSIHLEPSTEILEETRNSVQSMTNQCAVEKVIEGELLYTPLFQQTDHMNPLSTQASSEFSHLNKKESTQENMEQMTTVNNQTEETLPHLNTPSDSTQQRFWNVLSPFQESQSLGAADNVLKECHTAMTPFNSFLNQLGKKFDLSVPNSLPSTAVEDEVSVII